MSDPAAKVRVEHLSKIFGPSPGEAVARLEAGASKEAIFRDTGNVVAVADISFTVGRGELFVVMGLSGSGKSTLVRCVNRLIEPTSGRLYIDDEDVLAVDGERLRRVRLTKVSMVFQHFALFPHKTVAENVEYGLKVRGIDPERRRERALGALDLVGLRGWADAAPDSLSGGMQQRVGLARALAVDPEVLLMDEPFGALDPLIRRDMQAELIELQRRLRMTIIFITHDLHEALTLGDHVAIMKDGRFVQVGAPEEIVGAPADPYVASFTRDVDRGRVFTVGTVMRDAHPLALGRDSVDEAVRRMRALGREALYVTDGRGAPVGVVLGRDAAEAERRRRGADGGGAADVAAVMRTAFPQTARSAKLADVFELCRAGLPVAVVDDRGLLRGVVDPLDVLAELAGGAGAGGGGGAAVAAAEARHAQPL